MIAIVITIIVIITNTSTRTVILTLTIALTWSSGISLASECEVHWNAVAGLKHHFHVDWTGGTSGGASACLLDVIRITVMAR
jgi:hypothetical protein